MTIRRAHLSEEKRHAGNAAEQVAPRATPAARRLASRTGVDLWTVIGTGHWAKILKRDVEEALRTIKHEYAASEYPTDEYPVRGHVRLAVYREAREYHEYSEDIWLREPMDYDRQGHYWVYTPTFGAAFKTAWQCLYCGISADEPRLMWPDECHRERD